MKSVHILQFQVQRDGELFGPDHPNGAILHDLPDAEADALIAGSNGTIVELPASENHRQTESDPEESKSIERMTIPELKAFAAECEIDLGTAKTKAEITEVIQTALAESVSDSDNLSLESIDPQSTVK